MTHCRVIGTRNTFRSGLTLWSLLPKIQWSNSFQKGFRYNGGHQNSVCSFTDQSIIALEQQSRFYYQMWKSRNAKDINVNNKTLKKERTKKNEKEQENPQKSWNSRCTKKNKKTEKGYIQAEVNLAYFIAGVICSNPISQLAKLGIRTMEMDGHYQGCHGLWGQIPGAPEIPERTAPTSAVGAEGGCPPNSSRPSTSNVEKGIAFKSPVFPFVSTTLCQVGPASEMAMGTSF
ncbi:hypothetical protein CEXT_381951 [Caerostris extrusa]|uniref:Uncharacterized protein n=1 Tax=Caerostris extrusa TaxID=172846 RepID=A0AAV4VUV8_CAEEX|nr:hypothetical protein CEXT_381951 [Caerostris extrusa]